MPSVSLTLGTDGKPEFAVNQIIDPELRKEIALVVAEGVALAMKEYDKCSCNLSADAAQEVGHFMGMVRDIGGSKHSNGIEAMREHHKAVGLMLEGRRAFWCMVFKMAGTALVG